MPYVVSNVPGVYFFVAFMKEHTVFLQERYFYSKLYFSMREYNFLKLFNLLKSLYFACNCLITNQMVVNSMPDLLFYIKIMNIVGFAFVF